MQGKLKLIGRREYVDLPELQITGMEAKVDTGAYTSALHCHDIEVRTINGKQTLCFYLLDPLHPEYNEKEHHFTDFYKKTIKSSSGEAEERYIIKTLILLGGKRVRTSISLTDRGGMRYPVLIGRKMIKNKFIIDVNQIHTSGLVLSKAFPYLR
ncbi:MAG TPA: RimK/LysX family protein [Bacteroidia bacterium]|nr:RimK/LysX family protein [Bacteroidia bacterium]